MGSLRIALGKMAAAGEKDLPAALAKGVAAIKSAKTGGDAAAKAIELFGARAGPDMAAAIREGRFEVADLIKQLDGSQGAVERTGKATLTFSDKMGRLRNQAALAGSSFGAMLIPYIEKLLGYGTRLVAWVSGLSKGQRDLIIKVGFLVAAMGPLLVVVGKVTSGVGRLTGAAGKLVLAFGKGGKAAPLWARGIAAVTKGVAAFVRQAALAIVSVARQAAAWVAETAAKVAATAATVAHAVATKAAAAAQWLLNAALTANPIGLVDRRDRRARGRHRPPVEEERDVPPRRDGRVGRDQDRRRRRVELARGRVQEVGQGDPHRHHRSGGPARHHRGEALGSDQGRRGEGVVGDQGHGGSRLGRDQDRRHEALARHRLLLQAQPGRHHRAHWAKIKSGVSSAWSAITGAVKRLWSGIIDYFKGTLSAFAGIGRAIVDGHQAAASAAPGARSSRGSRA